MINKIEVGEVDNKINVIFFFLMGIIIIIYFLIGIVFYLEWILFFILLWDYYIFEKGLWYFIIIGWVNKIVIVLIRIKKDNIYKIVFVGIFSFVLFLRMFKRF